MNKLVITTALMISGLFLQACSQGDKLTAHPRGDAFYNQFVNSSADWPQAENKVDELKLLQTGEQYPIRIALFDNGRFYYQIDKLGTGDGQWAYGEGAIHATANRPIFDMELTVSAAAADGDETLVRFFDRHGFNSYKLQFRDPQALKEQGKQPEQLRKFKRSEKNI
jgi:hypothetical protein